MPKQRRDNLITALRETFLFSLDAAVLKTWTRKSAILRGWATLSDPCWRVCKTKISQHSQNEFQGVHDIFMNRSVFCLKTSWFIIIQVRLNVFRKSWIKKIILLNLLYTAQFCIKFIENRVVKSQIHERLYKRTIRAKHAYALRNRKTPLLLWANKTTQNLIIIKLMPYGHVLAPERVHAPFRPKRESLTRSWAQFSKNNSLSLSGGVLCTYRW